MPHFLDFEQPIAKLAGKIEELRRLTHEDQINITSEISRLQKKADRLLRQTYAQLTSWQRVQVARHPERPHFNHYVGALFAEFTPLAGDRAFADDKAVQGGLARFQGQPCVVIGHEKGDSTAARVAHNFGMARPEGYRKAIRLMELADRFQLPVITLVDTAGAWPGVGAEERGQAEAIARSIEKCLDVETPLVSIVIGEGGSGGAVALAAADRVMMLEHAVYSVISPEGCASILWRSADHARNAAEALRLTAPDLLAQGLVDEVVPEPVGGAHRDPEAAAAAVGAALATALGELSGMDGAARRARRREKFLAMGGGL